jgi:hypothetical protein
MRKPRRSEASRDGATGFEPATSGVTERPGLPILALVNRYMLGAPGDRARKRGRRRAGARIMREFGGQAIDSITTTQVERWLEGLDAEDVSKRTVNTYRQLVCSVLEHAARRPERYRYRPTSRGSRRSAASLTRASSTSTSPRRSRRSRAPRAQARTAIPRGQPSRKRKWTSAGEPTTKTQRCSSLPPSRDCAWASCWNCAGGGSASSGRP